MQTDAQKAHYRIAIVTVQMLLCNVFFLSSPVQADAAPRAAIDCSSRLAPSEEAALKREIDARLSFGSRNAKKTASPETPAEIQVSIGGLRKNHKDAVVYLNGNRYCGSGGCTILVLADDRSASSSSPAYRHVSGFITAKTPIVALKTSHHGWRDLGVFVSGGGITEGYTATLMFDGKRYQGNPTLPSRHKAPTAGIDTVLIGQPDRTADQCTLSL
ncbi:hypothetical protein [Xanthomonas prunicola]|uniref:Uncharacterized protein n=1 Tax=Xanthomonas prunicola TaxID=2053930 RepID=A0A2N3RLP8_9XANT|nr:hypothetical protein [Xanthomonas prunicola]PKV13416.1 hypothetical protein XpruCFBP8353_09445 [Xanthomonas prunicola]PKV17691.1 hypothetical protein XpruCFBP8354_09445 [Xanthomonas prunicola]PKV21589.1 hypothetical protein CVO74_11500 [Xanthomonas prunicola]